MRYYIIINKLFGYPCYGGKRFYTKRGLAKAINRLPIPLEWIEVRSNKAGTI